MCVCPCMSVCVVLLIVERIDSAIDLVGKTPLTGTFLCPVIATIKCHLLCVVGYMFVCVCVA